MVQAIAKRVRMRARRIVLLSTILLTVAACGDARHRPSATPGAANSTTTTFALTPIAAHAVEILRAQPPPLPKAKPDLARPPSTTPASPKRKSESLVDVNLKLLIGMTEDEVELLLGPARAKTLSTVSHSLDYQFDKCHLRLYLFAELQTGEFRVLHLEKEPVAGESGRLAPCRIKLASSGSPVKAY